MKSVSLRLTDAEYQLLRRYADATESSLNDAVRELVRDLEVSEVAPLSLNNLLDMYRNRCAHYEVTPVAQSNLELIMLAHDAKELQLLAVGPGMYECYLDGRFFAFGSYEEVLGKLGEIGDEWSLRTQR